MKPKAYMLVFDGLADWEASYALPEIKNSDKFSVVTVGLSSDPVTTMGGLRVIPDTTLDALKPSDAAILILPGGDLWQQKPDENIIRVVREFHDAQVPVAAICAATVAIAQAGLTRGARHTSNAQAYLKWMVPDYQDEEFYVDELAVADRGLITASGLGAVEFTREILRELKIHDEANLRVWFDMFKHGIPPKGEFDEQGIAAEAQ
jgi:putative intracellular protease/amidase